MKLNHLKFGDWAIFVSKGGEAMFDTQGNRYITRGVNEQVPKEMQQRCFQLIDEKVK